nr:MAG TPA: Phosphodiester glycosidase [Caudoviricetes sp.]
MKHREFPPFIPTDECKCKPAPAPYEPPCCTPCGMTTEEQIMHLNDKVDCMASTYNQVMSECYKTLHNLEEAAEENGAYYGAGEVWTEQGYYADESATYTLTHKAVVDRHGNPIRIGLHLAYDNTTNSKIEQDMFSASKVLYADKILVAQPKTANGWYGNVIYRGAPIATHNDGTLYTVGFTKAGVMRVYQNGIDKEQMLRDTIENAMGCSGVLILNGQLTDDSYRANIPNATEQVARVVIGQNSDTREVIFLTCGNENNVNRKGMTSKACAQILLQYGCDIAVELCEADSAGAMNKGQFMFVPDNNVVPTAYCYWYISRRCFYKNDYTREVAELMQNYGQVIWENFLTGGKLDNTIAKLNKEIADRIAADNELQENINAEADTRAENDTVLQENINAEITRATAAEKTLQTNIDNEKKRAQSAEKNLEDTKVNRAGDTMTGSLSLPNSESLNIGNQTKFFNLGINTGNDAMQLKSDRGIVVSNAAGTNPVKISGVENATEPYEAVNKKQLDAEILIARNAIDAEQKRAQKTEQQLQANIDAEQHARENADTALHNDIVTEQGERAAEDADLLAAINKEKEDRAAADSTLQTNINTEKSERLAGDNALSTQLSDLSTDLDTERDVRQGQINDIKNGNLELPYLSNKTGGTVNGNIVVTNGVQGNLSLSGKGESNNTPEITSTGTSLTLTVANGDIIVKNNTDTDGKGMITNLDVPSRDTDAVNKAYVDNGLNLKAGLAESNTFSGTLNAFNSRVVVTRAPTADNDVANKKYVDDHAGGGGDVTAAGENTFTGHNVFTGDTSFGPNEINTFSGDGVVQIMGQLTVGDVLSSGTIDFSMAILDVNDPTSDYEAVNLHYLKDNYIEKNTLTFEPWTFTLADGSTVTKKIAIQSV